MFLRKTRQKIADLEKLVVQKNSDIIELKRKYDLLEVEKINAYNSYHRVATKYVKALDYIRELEVKFVRKRDKLGRFIKK